MQIKSCNVLWACICPLRNCPSSESDALLLLQDFTLHVLFDVMTDAWGDDPAADDDAEDAAPADALMDAVPSDDPYADAAGEAGSLHEAEVSTGAGLEDLLAELVSRMKQVRWELHTRLCLVSRMRQVRMELRTRLCLLGRMRQVCWELRWRLCLVG